MNKWALILKRSTEIFADHYAKAICIIKWTAKKRVEAVQIGLAIQTCS